MADKYASVAGFVQKFGDKPAVEEREANNQTVRQFVVKALGSQKLIRITVWPEFASTGITAGDFVAVDGKFSVTQGKNGGEFYGVSASTLFVASGATKAAREVVNQNAAATQTSSGDDDAPPF